MTVGWCVSSLKTRVALDIHPPAASPCYARIWEEKWGTFDSRLEMTLSPDYSTILYGTVMREAAHGIT
jgi:hypothetical protein